ncbi:unnamed protein product [Didymodactylos carnosus]|uniref:Uncharacterized protein n=1 Tax=Didymodactylos carnosus TaxID=1234261 RepID=A0A814DMV1_9BILA|nr:unnamed protein product [Didymodactylos carnosus]CAF0956668.1 unnamed protein product [Didymodactylos carnosus]CAF3709299.1 unnamed protein product [Didymodactylos carnosus]CAF3731616.1 unnamed protein product [Didymodactylos carnosus]
MNMLLNIRRAFGPNNLYKFQAVKDEIRELFNHIKKAINQLKSVINKLQTRVSSFEQLHDNENEIKTGNIAAQLRVKLVRYLKPSLTHRQARDEYVDRFQSVAKYQELDQLIRTQNSELSVSNLENDVEKSAER